MRNQAGPATPETSIVGFVRSILMPSTFPVLQLPALSQTCADSAARALPSPLTIVEFGWAAILELGSGSVAVQSTVTSSLYQPFAFGCDDACPVTVRLCVSSSCDDCGMSFQGRSTGKPILSIRAGRSIGMLGHAHICDGSAIRRTVLGLTPRHAAKRATRMVGRPVPTQTKFQ